MCSDVSYSSCVLSWHTDPPFLSSCFASESDSILRRFFQCSSAEPAPHPLLCFAISRDCPLSHSLADFHNLNTVLRRRFGHTDCCSRLRSANSVRSKKASSACCAIFRTEKRFSSCYFLPYGKICEILSLVVNLPCGCEVHKCLNEWLRRICCNTWSEIQHFWRYT